MSRLHANTSSPVVYWRKQPKWQAHLELCHRNPETLERVLNWIVYAHVSVSTMHAKALECMQKNKLENFEVPLKAKIIETFITEMSYYCLIETSFVALLGFCGCTTRRHICQHFYHVCIYTLNQIRLNEVGK